jgi:hypothetical protein
VAFKSGHSPFCSRCRSRNFRREHPAMAHFLDLKNRAKQRGHEFTITVEYSYQTVWVDTGYAEKHGKTKECLSVDRKENDKGYVPGNLQVMTVSENARKRFVPFWKNKAEQDAAIAEAEKAAREAYPDGGGQNEIEEAIR